MESSKSKHPTRRSKPEPKVFDVKRPGASAPSSTARPIVVSHKPLMQDPMVVAAAGGAEPANAPAPPGPHHNGYIQPGEETARAAESSEELHHALHLQPSPETARKPAKLAGTEQSAAQPQTAGPESANASAQGDPLLDINDVPPATGPLGEQAATSPQAVTSPVTAPETPVADRPPEPRQSEAPPLAAPVVALPSNSPESAEVQGLLAPPEPSPAKPEAPLPVAASPATAPAEPAQSESAPAASMPGNQDFHVHIAKPHRQHPLRLAVIGAVLIIVVALGCADALLDAGVMTISGVPHTHFIKR